MRPRGSYKKSEASKRQVLDAAIRALSEQGYARTSVNDIASAAGMSKGAVHYHFESKDDLIAHVLDHCAAVMRERVTVAWDSPGTPLERIIRSLREMRVIRKQASPELRVLADLMAQGLHDRKLSQTIQVMLDANRQQVAEGIISSLPELGVRTKIPAHVIPRLLLGTLDGLALHDFFDPPSDEDDAEIDKALEMIALSLFELPEETHIRATPDSVG